VPAQSPPELRLADGATRQVCILHRIGKGSEHQRVDFIPARSRLRRQSPRRQPGPASNEPLVEIPERTRLIQKLLNQLPQRPIVTIHEAAAATNAFTSGWARPASAARSG